MPRYSSGMYTDPQEMQQMSGNPWYNPLSPYPDWGNGIRQTLNTMWAYKEQKKKAEEARQKEEAAAERQARLDEIERRKAEFQMKREQAQTDLYSEQAKALLGKQEGKFNASPTALQSLGKTLGMPPEMFDGIENWSPEQKEGTWDDLRKALIEVNKQKLIQAGPSADIKRDAAERKSREDRIKQQGGLIVAGQKFISGLRQPFQKQLEGIDKNPMYLDEESKAAARQPIQSALDNIDRAAGEIAAYGWMLSAGSEIPDEAQSVIKNYLNNPKKIKTGEIWEVPKPPQMPLQAGDLLGMGGWQGAVPQGGQNPFQPSTTPPVAPKPNPNVGPGPTQPDPQQQAMIQQLANEILNRAARNGKQLNPQEAMALAVQYLQSKQNAPR